MWENFLEFLDGAGAQRLGVALAATAVVLVARMVVRRTLIHRIEDNTAHYRTRKLVNFGGYLVIAFILAVVYSDYLGGLTVAFGVAGAGVAFALQEVIVSIAGWVAVTFGRMYRVGDRVKLGGIRGDIIDIGILRSTVFEVGEWVNGDLYNGRVVRVANSFVFKDPVFNYSAEFPFLWDEVVVPIRHAADQAQARRLLEQALEETVGDYSRKIESTWDKMTRNYVIEHARIDPMVTMTFDENWCTYTLRYPVDFRQRRSTKDELSTLIFARIEATQGAVSLASAAQEITVMPASSIKTTQGAG